METTYGTRLINLTKILTLGLLLGLGIQALFAWTAPPAAAPGGTVAGPLTTGAVDQIKVASLGLTGNLVIGSLGANKSLCLNGSCITAWPSGGSGIGNVVAGCVINESFLCLGAANSGYSCWGGAVGQHSGSVYMPNIVATCPAGSTKRVISYLRLGLCSGEPDSMPIPIFICVGDSGGTGSGDNLGNHTATQNLNLANFKITNLANPTNAQDSATKAYVDQKTATFKLVSETTCDATTVGQTAIGVTCSGTYNDGFPCYADYLKLTTCTCQKQVGLPIYLWRSATSATCN